jgi:hypothetical protein
LDKIDVTADVFRDFHERTRPWSPFNYQVYGRVNRDDRVIGIAFGQRIEIGADGSVHQRELDERERLQFLIEELGIREELAVTLPADVPTPPPPAVSASAGTWNPGS